MDILIACWFIIPGLLAGWLVNYLSDVLPTLDTLSRPVCRHCGGTFRWRDYFLMRTCQNCKHARSWRTGIVLITAIVISVALWINYPPKLGYWISLLLLTYFGVVVVIDLEHRLILHVVTLTGAALGLLVGILNNGLFSTLIGGTVGLGIMLLFYFFGMMFARYRARKLGVDDGEEALGFGDVTLSGVIGLMLGWPHIAKALLIAVLAGGLVSILLILVLSAMRRFQSMNVFTAYGPYLVLGAVLLIFFPQVAGFLAGM